MSLQLLNDVARDFPGTPQAQLALQNKLRIETERRDLRAIDPVTKQEGPAVIATLRHDHRAVPRRAAGAWPRATGWR